MSNHRFELPTYGVYINIGIKIQGNAMNKDWDNF